MTGLKEMMEPLLFFCTEGSFKMTAEEKNHDHFSQVNKRLVNTKLCL